jgi:hypothetical protein
VPDVLAKNANIAPEKVCSWQPYTDEVREIEV